MMNENITISIVTVCYNAENDIERTILSVINQTYSNIEYIIIDGGSTDRTVDIIKKYENHISYWISEPDNGIYNAMNKGIKVATGEWINFMNAGDTFYNESVITDIFRTNYQCEILYGNVYYHYKNLSIIEKANKPYIYNKNLSFCHQSSFVKCNIIKKYPFNVEYKLAADYAMFMNFIDKNFQFNYIDLCISIYDINGISTNNWKTNYENFKIYNIYNKVTLKTKIIFYVKLLLFQKIKLPFITKIKDYLFFRKIINNPNKYIILQ